MNQLPLLTLLTFTPLIGALILLGVGNQKPRVALTLALTFQFIALALVGRLWTEFDPTAGELQFVERYAWIPYLSVEYFLALDGLSLMLVLLTGIVPPLALFVGRGQDRSHLYCALMLLLQTGLFGTFTALNFFHWFLFWELSLVPAFFLVKFWGGPQRSTTATQFFVYTMVGSIALLLSFLAIFLATGSFDFIRLAELGRSGELASALNAKLGWYSLGREQLPMVIFLGAFLGFAVKVPLIPLHTWLPSTYAEAPSSTTMVLTGVMSKMGVYGFVRILMPLFPEQMRVAGTWLLWLAVISIVFSAGAALAQKDLKRMLAYSSINHLGYCLLGIFAVASFAENQPRWQVEKALALNGVVLQIFNHGLTASLLFAFIGFLEQRSGGLRGLDDFGGLRKVAPVFCGLMGIALFSSLGLPGLNGFVGEFLVFKGAFALSAWATSLSVIGLLVTAVFLLTLLQRVFSGPLNSRWNGFPDLTVTERLVVAPAIVLIFLLGIYPQALVGVVNQAVLQLVERQF